MYNEHQLGFARNAISVDSMLSILETHFLPKSIMSIDSRRQGYYQINKKLYNDIMRALQELYPEHYARLVEADKTFYEKSSLAREQVKLWRDDYPRGGVKKSRRARSDSK